MKTTLRKCKNIKEDSKLLIPLYQDQKGYIIIIPRAVVNAQEVVYINNDKMFHIT
jgi:hypothetical protein